MMNRKEYIAALITHFIGPFMASIAQNEPTTIAVLESCNCIVQQSTHRPIVEFSLGALFDALWRHGKSHELPLPTQSNWDADFHEFCKQFMNPWPQDEKIKKYGYALEPLHKSNSYARCKFRLMAQQ